MKVKELREKSENELKDLIKDLRSGLRKARFTGKASSGKNVKSSNQSKREIARIFTILNEQKNGSR